MPGTPWCHAPAKLFTWIEIIIVNYSWALHLCAKLCSEHFISIKSYNLHSDFWTTSQVRKRKSESWEIAGMAGHEVHQLRPEKAPVVRSRPSLPASAGPAPNTQPRSQSRCFCLTQEDSTGPCAARPPCCLPPPAPGQGLLQAGRPPYQPTPSSSTKTTPAGARRTTADTWCLGGVAPHRQGSSLWSDNSSSSHH